MVTAVSKFIEQAGSMIKEFQNTIIPLITPSSFKELAQTVHMHPPAGYYLVLNRIITSRWMHMYMLASRQVSLLAL